MFEEGKIVEKITARYDGEVFWEETNNRDRKPGEGGVGSHRIESSSRLQ